jgi:Tfp pilus assembly protein PilP
MKLTTGILAVGMMTGGLWAQNPTVINNVQSTTAPVQQKKTNDSNVAPGVKPTPAASQTAKPGPGVSGKPVVVAPVASAQKKAPVAVAVKPQAVPVIKKVEAPHVVAQAPVKPELKVVSSAGPTIVRETKTAETAKNEAPKPEEKKWAMSGKRDPFFSPVVQQPTGSGCSTGKKCLEIGQINLRGVVKSESGFVAVVTNSLNKAYFLHENDPVFNGYVMRITGDTVVFEETVQDKLGKPFTREVVKKIYTPAV